MKFNPLKRWECACCFEVYGSRTIDKSGGWCPNCGYGVFEEIDPNESIYLREGNKKR